MKLVTYTNKNLGNRLGVLTPDENQILDLQTIAEAMDQPPSPMFTDMLAFISHGAPARAKAQQALAFAAEKGERDAYLAANEVTLHSPLPRPESIRDCMAFEDHIINLIRTIGFKRLAPLDAAIEKLLGRPKSLAYRLNSAFYERPLYYKSNRFSVVGTEAEVHIPAYTQQLDYELEWGIFIGKKGKNIPIAKAGEYIAGYTIFNDFSARDIQMKEQAGRLGPAKGKDFDTGNAIGPFLVTPDELPTPYALTMTACVNGEQWSKGTTADMHWRFEEIIAYISQSETLYPGEFIGSGTCSGPTGRGCGLEMGKFLKSGDEVELTVEGIGTLRNKIV